MNEHMINYKPKDFSELLHVFSCRTYGMRKYTKKIEEDKEIAKSIQS